MQIRFYILLSLIGLCFSWNVSAAADSDSLKKVLLQPVHDTIKISVYQQLGDGIRSQYPDSAIRYYNHAITLCENGAKQKPEIREYYLLQLASTFRLKGLAFYLRKDNQKALDYFQQSLKRFKDLNDSENQKTGMEAKKGMAKCYGNFGAVIKDEGRYGEALEYFDKAIRMALAAGDKKTQSVAYNNKGITYYYMGEYEKSVESYTMAAKLFGETGDKQSKSAALANIGLVYTAQGFYVKSVESYHESLKILEELDDVPGIASCYNNIGIVYYEQRSYEKALDYYRKALKKAENQNVDYILASIYTNMGNVYSDQSTYKTALDYYFKALTLREEMNDRYSMSGLYNNVGLIYYYLKDYSSALQYYSKSLDISKELGDKSSMAKALGNLSALYVRLAEKESADRSMYLSRAVDAGLRSYDLAMEIGAIPVQNTTAGQLQRAYTYMQNYKEALHFAEVVINTKDSMFSDEKMQVMAEVNAKYESERQELEIENLNKENRLKQMQLKNSETQRSKQRIIIYTFIAGLILVVLFSALLLRMFIQKKKANRLLARQKEQIEAKNTLLEQANEEIHAQKDEIEAQRDMVVKQKGYIEEQQKEIFDSIRYARRIQNAVLPTGSRAGELLGNHFVFFRPRDVVSGDFYWVSKVNNFLVIAVADCTGHGVPGAFMSMMGIGLLNEIVRKEEVRNAADILNVLRDLLVESLNQERSIDTEKEDLVGNYQVSKEETGQKDVVVKDGMDVSLTVINTDTLQSHWAGAYSPLYLVSCCSLLASGSQRPGTRNQELVEFKGDKMPVALHYRMQRFTNHEIQLNKGDRIYLFTDGYADQFGGTAGKKLGYKRFKALLAETSDRSIKDQGEALAAFYSDWIQSGQTRYSQVDDITVLGIEIG